MSNSKLTHVKSLANPNYIGSYTLQVDDDKYEDLTVQIEKVEEGEIIDPNSRAKNEEDRKKHATLVYLVGQKPLVLNATNRQALCELFGTPFVEKWVGRKFTLYVAVIRAFGKPTPALRVRPELPVEQLPDFNPSSQHWQTTITALKAGETTVSKIKLKRSLTPDNEALLVAAEGEAEDAID